MSPYGPTRPPSPTTPCVCRYQIGMSEGLAKQAKTLTDRQLNRALAEVATHRCPECDRVMVLLSVKGRAKEIAMVTWSMVTDARRRVA